MPITSPYGNIDIPSTNLLTHLFSRDGAITDQPVWIDSNDTSNSLSTAQAVYWVKRLGCGLQKLGLKRGDVVLLCTTNHIYVPVAYLGIVGATCVFSGANPNYTPSELAHQLANADAKLILSHPSKLDGVLEAADKVKFPRSRIFQFSDAVNPVRDGIQDWSAFFASEAEASGWSWPELGADEARRTVATINYSSGTTGLPKGVCVSHANLIANIEQSLHVRDHGAAMHPEEAAKRGDERSLAFLPLYHAYGQLYTIIRGAHQRGTIYVLAEFKPEAFLAALEKYKITDLAVAPPILVMLAKRPDVKNYDLSSLKRIGSGAAPLKTDLQNEVQSRFNVTVRQGWGMTELTCSAIASSEYDKDLGDTVGRIHPNCELKLIDDDGKEVGVNQPGEILYRGPQVCMGYWRNEKATKELIDPEGWLKTGDIAVYNEEGYIWIVDRKKELIKVNGLQVAPAELESLLLENEHVADAAVVGITIDSEEYPRAYVHIQDASKGSVSPQDIQDWLAPRVAKHKRLAGGVAFVDAVPKLPSGKIVRKLMREWAKRDALTLEEQGFKARM